jgi:hypothetical protein
MMIPEGNGGPINPRLLLLHQLMGPIRSHVAPYHDPRIHSFGPGGSGNNVHPPAPGIDGLAAQLAQVFSAGHPNPLAGIDPGVFSGNPAGGQDASGFAQGFVPPAPQLAPGTYDGNYAAQGLRTTNPAQAAQLWESRHPAQVRSGHIPGWVGDAMGGEAHQVLGQMHGDTVQSAHERAAALAKLLARQRGGRGLRRSLRNFSSPQAPPQNTYSAS